jgi:hypothetical protein
MAASCRSRSASDSTTRIVSTMRSCVGSPSDSAWDSRLLTSASFRVASGTGTEGFISAGPVAGSKRGPRYFSDTCLRSCRVATGPRDVRFRNGGDVFCDARAQRATLLPSTGHPQRAVESRIFDTAPLPLVVRSERHANRSRLQSASELSVSATRGRVPRRGARRCGERGRVGA